MTMENDLHALLATLCPRVSPDIAEAGTAMPYITYQGLGGASWRYTENTPAPQRATLMQINVWATTRLAALALARQVEEAMCAASTFTARPVAEPLSTVEDGSPRAYGCAQDFDIWSAR